MKRNYLAMAIGAALAVSLSAPVMSGSDRGKGYEHSQGSQHAAPISSLPSFNKLDTNGDGSVDVSEAEGQIEQSTFVSADVDGDDRLSKSEFQALHTSTAQSMGEVRGGGNSETTAEAEVDNTQLRAEFETLDGNQDGYISADEAQGNAQLTSKWNEADLNADGQLDRAEFSAFETEGVELSVDTEVKSESEMSADEIPQQPKSLPDHGM